MNTIDSVVDEDLFTDEELHRLEFFKWLQHEHWIHGESTEWKRLNTDQLARNEIAKNRAAFERLIPVMKELA